jgi:cell division septum initiation protein DivIVA
MRYTPVELKHVRIGRALFGGYKRDEIDKLLEDVADSYATVWSERGELTDKLEDVERALAEVKQRESLLASTLVAAEKASAEVREAAKHEAELIVAEAHHEARAVTRAAHGERERLFAEVRRIETLLRAALGMVEESSKDLPLADQPPEAWPKREQTREFQAVQLPAAADEQSEESSAGPWEDRDFAWG